MPNLVQFKDDWLSELVGWPESRHAGSFVGWYDQRKKACWSALGLACWAADLQPHRGGNHGYYFHYGGNSFTSYTDSRLGTFALDYNLMQPVRLIDVLDLGWQDIKVMNNLLAWTRSRYGDTVPLLDVIDELESLRCTLITIHKLVQGNYHV